MRRRTLIKAAGAALLPLPAIAQPAAAATLRYVPGSDLTVLDPVWTTAAISGQHGYLVFDTLYATDTQLRPRPQMAVGQTVSDDGLTWLIRLREGLLFHDGEPVRAADCCASLARWMARDPFGQLLAPAHEAWEAADDRTIRIRLKRPFPLLIDALAKALTPAFIMPERLAKTDPNTPVTEMTGSGPYRFLKDEYVSGHHVGYAKFDRYVPRDEAADGLAGGKRATFPRIVWQIIPDPATAAAALRAGEVDWWEFALPDLIPSLAADPNIRVLVTDRLGFYSILRFNMVIPPFDNPRLRRALLMAVDQDDFMRPITNNDPSDYRTCYAMLPCGLPHSHELAADIMKPPKDLARSRQAIKDAGYNGEKVVILNPTDLASLEPMGEVAADLLKKLGMNVDLQAMDWGSVVKRRQSTEPVERGGWNIFPTNGGPLVIGPPALNIYIRGQGAKGWVGWYDNPEIERLTQEWLNSETDADRDNIYDAMQRSALESPPFIPVGQFFPRTAFRSDIAGMQQFVIPTPWTLSRTG